MTVESEKDDMLLQSRVSKEQAKRNIDHLASFAGNMLAVLFNVYSQTLPQYRGHILRCINAYLSITPEPVGMPFRCYVATLMAMQELNATFEKVITMLESSLEKAGPQTQADKQKQAKSENKMPPLSHTFMDLVITIAIYLPRDCYASLFNMAALIIVKDDDPQLQKKAYKLIPRLAGSESGQEALRERNSELQGLLLSSADKTSSAAKRDRLAAMTQIIEYMPSSDPHNPLRSCHLRQGSEREGSNGSL